MSNGNGGVGGGGGRGYLFSSSSSSAVASAVGGASSIPAGCRKIVQNLREIVNYPDQEIYAMLKECNMDPSETVNRLLNQDTFQEVKSKRDKKKEVKETPDPKARGVSKATNRGARACNDRALHAGYSSSNDYGLSRSKPLLKKENSTNTVSTPSILGSAVSGNGINGISHSQSTPSIHMSVQVVPGIDGLSLSSKPSLVFQHAWSGAPGQVSMADIVRMGRPHGRSSNISATIETPLMSRNAIAVNNFQVNVKQTTPKDLPTESLQECHSSQDSVSKVSEAIHDSATAAIDETMSLCSQSLAKQLPVENKSLVEVPESPRFHDDGLHLHLGSSEDDIPIANNNINCEDVVTESVDASCDEQLQLTDSQGRLKLDDASSESPSCYQSQRHMLEHNEVEDINSELLSVTTDLQHISIQNEDLAQKPAEDNPAVIFPNDLQVTSVDCSHLSFGSFGSGIPSASISESLKQKALKNSLEPSSTTSEVSPFDHVDARNIEFYNDEQTTSTLDETAAPGASMGTESYDQSSSSQPTETDSTHPANELHYSIPSLRSGNEFSGSAQPIAGEYSQSETNSQAQNLASFSNMMNLMQQAYANSLQSNLLASVTQPGRELDPYLSLLVTQSMPTKFNTVIASLSEPTIPIPETLKSSFFSVPQGQQPTSQALEGSSIPTGPTLPQHLTVHPYSQPTLPLGHFANMIGYQFLPPSYAYLPSAAFQPTYTGNNAYHQSPPAIQTAAAKFTLPQYKNSVSLGNLPQSSTLPSGYGNFGSSANMPGSFVLNQPSTLPNTSFDDTMGSQYKEANPYASLQPSENANMWVQGVGSRTMSAVPANTYYNLQGQSQHSGFRQTQQQPSHYGNLGYPNFYRSQVGLSQEHQQNSSDIANLTSSQGLPSQSSHHLWQRNY